MRRIVWFAAIFVIALNSGVWAAGKVTVDPNEGTARAQIEEWDADARLSQKVTYEARHKAVKTILADLSEMTGITFNAGYNKNDWQVRDRKMNIFAKDTTLADLMSSIARVMKFKWSVNKDDVPWTYRLYMDRKTLVTANAELSKAQKEWEEEIARRRQSFLNMIENWDDDLPASELEEMRRDNPYMYLLHSRGIGAAIRGMFEDSPDLKNIFLNKERDLTISMDSLTPETQNLVLTATQNGYYLIGNEFAGKGEPFPEDYEKDFVTKGRVLFDFEPDELDWKAYEHRKLGGIGVYVGEKFFNFLGILGEPTDPVNKIIAEEDLQVYEKGIPIQEVWPQYGDQWLNAKTEECKILEKFFPSEPQSEIQDEPDLHKKIKVELDYSKRVRLPDMVSALAQASGFAVVSDSYKFAQGYAVIGDAETELADVIKTICEGYRYNWDKHKDVIELRSKEWFKKRSTQIPDEWLERWRENMKKIGYMSIDDYAQINALTTEQIMENILTDEDFWKANIFLSSCSKDIWLMRLYGSMSVEQKKLLFSDLGIDTIAFTPEQMIYIRKVYQTPAFNKGFDARVQCSQILGQDGVPEYTFSLIGSAINKVIGHWTISMLKYEPPKPEPEPKKTEEKKTDEEKSDATSTSAELAKK
jgi:hypothetical protein